jgi:hypothetical protein
MFIVHWVFDKLGYMPKIDMQIGKVDLKVQKVWPFPAEQEKPKAPAKKPAVKKATTRKSATKKAK